MEGNARSKGCGFESTPRALVRWTLTAQMQFGLKELCSNQWRRLDELKIHFKKNNINLL